MNKFYLKLLLLLGILIYSLNANAYEYDRLVTLLSPPLKGPQPLGLNVATVLNTHIWSTLRKAPWPNPENLNFGDGLILYYKKSFPNHNHAYMEKKVISQSAQFILWGEVYKFGEGVVAQTYFSIPNYKDRRISHPEKYELTINCDGKMFTFAVDIPERRYEFAPIALTSVAIKEYSKFHELPVYRTKRQDEIIGYIRGYINALQHDGDYAFVDIGGGKKGWVKMPPLSKTENEVSDFIAGIIRIYRGDWGGAVYRFKKVIGNSSTSTEMKMDSYLYQAIANEKRGLSSHTELQTALKLNSNYKPIFSYLIMHYLNQLKPLIEQKVNFKKRKLLIIEIKKIILTKKYLYSVNDKFLLHVNKLISQIE